MDTLDPARHTGSSLSYLCKRHLVTIAVIIYCLALPVQAQDFEGCTDCHATTLGEKYFNSNLHPPFIEHKCTKCHIAPEPAASEEEGPFLQKSQILWLAGSSIRDTSHVFPLPDGTTNGMTLVLETTQAPGITFQTKVAVPAFADLPEFRDVGLSPVISNVEVTENRYGITLNATIEWQTDSPADARVHYGEYNLAHVARLQGRYGKKHQIILYGLTPDRMYSFAAESRDLFGRSQISSVFSFLTSDPLPAIYPDRRPSIAERPSENTLVVLFNRIQDRYLLELLQAEPIEVMVGTIDAIQGTSSYQEVVASTLPDDEAHVGLSNKQYASLDACVICHPEQSRYTHPVNVLPRPSMVVPEDYPVLPDGRISCRSCHDTHGSDYEFLTIREHRRELCIGCHRRKK